jgi:hypothetical protein
MPSTIGDQISSFVHDFFGINPGPPGEPPGPAISDRRAQALRRILRFQSSTFNSGTQVIWSVARPLILKISSRRAL